MVAEPWRVVFAKAAQKDSRNIAASGLKAKVEELLAILREDPYRSRRRLRSSSAISPVFILVVSIGSIVSFTDLMRNATVQVVRMWTHYE